MEKGKIFFDNSIEGGFAIFEDNFFVGEHEEEFLFNNHQTRKTNQNNPKSKFRTLPENSAFANLFNALKTKYGKNFITIFGNSPAVAIKVADNETMEVTTFESELAIAQRNGYACNHYTLFHIFSRSENARLLESYSGLNNELTKVLQEGDMDGIIPRIMVAISVLKDATKRQVKTIKQQTSRVSPPLLSSRSTFLLGTSRTPSPTTSSSSGDSFHTSVQSVKTYRDIIIETLGQTKSPEFILSNLDFTNLQETRLFLKGKSSSKNLHHDIKFSDDNVELILDSMQKEIVIEAVNRLIFWKSV